MKIWYSPYQLSPKGLLNSKVREKFRKGALLRIRFEDDAVGYADVCPFAEMGDRPLEFELKHIAMSKPSNLGARSLFFARADAEARAKNASLYDKTVKIKNHFLIYDIDRFDIERIKKIESAGYSEFKIKMGRDIAYETEKVEKLSNRLSNRSRLRLDFNASFSRDRFVDWFDKNQKWLRPCLEFIEDPFGYDAKEWREVSEKRNVAFALDLAADPLSTGAEGARVVIIKPAIQDPAKIFDKFSNSDKKFVFTNHMDFPVGQMAALYTAQSFYHEAKEKILTCGLQHHDIYENTEFQEAIKNDGPYILPPDGFGFGFDKILEKQSWHEIG
ncbi:MAG: hypothetical protein A2Z20_08335 [Bdellovibrionales bacterium RBG_16_40_8]|nr:MAG: hypothetical protein A2Z20_08335 [Bdellovibrionales bacterium RBG_16_40_8]